MVALLLAIGTWIGTWGAAPVRAVDGSAFADHTLRQVVHVSIGGTRVRVRFTNRFGASPVVIGDAAVGVQDSGAGAVAGTQRRLTFMRLHSITIPPHADVLSDPVSLDLPPHSNLLVDIYLPDSVPALTEHTLAYETNYAASGDVAGRNAAQAFTASKESWYLLDAVEVSGTRARGAVVAVGDSITDGAGGKVNANDRWTDFLAARLSSLPQNRQFGVLDEGISGNRILLSDPRFGIDALARLDADAIAQSGVRTVMVFLGVNDIQQTPHQYDPERVEQGLQQIAARAHAAGLRAIGCTITPYGGWLTYDEKGESVRRAVNDFIRQSGIFDAVVDFDAAVRDPNAPNRLLPVYDSGDHLHPNAAGHRAMAAAVDISRLLW